MQLTSFWEHQKRDLVKYSFLVKYRKKSNQDEKQEFIVNYVVKLLTTWGKWKKPDIHCYNPPTEKNITTEHTHSGNYLSFKTVQYTVNMT